MTPPAVFSPTVTMDFDRCPIYRANKQQGWRRRDQAWTPNILLGNAIGDGLSECYRHWDAPNPEAFGVPAALLVLTAGYVETPGETLAGLTILITKGLAAAVEADAPRGRQIVRVDESVGVCRPDLVVRGPEGLATINTKVSRTIRSDYRAERLAEYETSYQLWHEAWEVGQYFGEPVVSRGVLQVVLSPRMAATLVEWPVTPEGMVFWLRGAEGLWAAMAAEQASGGPPAPRLSSCHGRYGRCDYFDFCHEFGGDPQRAGAYYTKEGW